MIKIRKANERGYRDHGWLKTYHSFSFSDYYDENHLHFANLRVINEDRIAPLQGFPMHPHRDMEIITYVLSGEIIHRDSMGNQGVVGAGNVQYMSAGTGVVHSEYNHSDNTELHLLQIWIIPDDDKVGIKPRYGQKEFPREKKINTFYKIAENENNLKDQNSTDENAPIALYASASISVGIITQANFAKPLTQKHNYLHLAKGKAKVGDINLIAGDALLFTDEKNINISDSEEAEFLLFEF